MEIAQIRVVLYATQNMLQPQIVCILLGHMYCTFGHMKMQVEQQETLWVSMKTKNSLILCVLSVSKITQR